MGVGGGEAGMVLGMGVSFRQSRGLERLWRDGSWPGGGGDWSRYTQIISGGVPQPHTRNLEAGVLSPKNSRDGIFLCGVGEDGRAGVSKGPSEKFGQKMTRLNSFSLDGISGCFSGVGVGIWSRGILEEESRD